MKQEPEDMDVIDYKITDFNNHKIFCRKDKKRVRYQLKLKDVKCEDSKGQGKLKCSGDYEHILLTLDKHCLRVLAHFKRKGEKRFLCRKHYEVGIPRKERLPEINAKEVDLVYQVDIKKIS